MSLIIQHYTNALDHLANLFGGVLAFKLQICFLFQDSHERGNRSDVRRAVHQHGVDRDQGREDVHQPADHRLEDQLHVARREPHLEGDQEGEDGGGGGV